MLFAWLLMYHMSTLYCCVAAMHNDNSSVKQPLTLATTTDLRHQQHPQSQLQQQQQQQPQQQSSLDDNDHNQSTLINEKSDEQSMNRPYINRTIINSGQVSGSLLRLNRTSGHLLRPQAMNASATTESPNDILVNDAPIDINQHTPPQHDHLSSAHHHKETLKRSATPTNPNEQLLIVNLNRSQINPDELPSYKLETNQIEDAPVQVQVPTDDDTHMMYNNEVHNIDFTDDQNYIDVQEYYASTPSASVESREQREMEMTVAELDAQLQWYVPVSVSDIDIYDEPATVIDGSGETLPTARIIEDELSEGSGFLPPTARSHHHHSGEASHGDVVHSSEDDLVDSDEDEADSDDSSDAVPSAESTTVRTPPIHHAILDLEATDESVRPVAILKPTRPQLCLGNRRNLTEQQITDIREEIREINGMIKYYVKRLMEFCVKHSEYNRLYFKCSVWMDRKQMYYTNYMRLKYCNPVGWPVFL